MDSVTIIDAIRDLVSTTKTKRKDVVTSVSGHSVIVKNITLPFMTEAELDESIQWEAERYIPFDINDVNIDFDGEGHNDEDSPVKPIAQWSDHLALFALTIGEEISTQITRFFKEGEFPLGAMLDSAASVGADLAADVFEARYRSRLYTRDAAHA